MLQTIKFLKRAQRKYHFLFISSLSLGILQDRERDNHQISHQARQTFDLIYHDSAHSNPHQKIISQGTNTFDIRVITNNQAIILIVTSFPFSATGKPRLRNNMTAGNCPDLAAVLQYVSKELLAPTLVFKPLDGASKMKQFSMQNSE